MRLESIVSFETEATDSIDDPFEIDADDLRSDDDIQDQQSEDEYLAEPETITHASTSKEMELYLPKHDSLCARQLRESGYHERWLSKSFCLWDHPTK